VIITRGIGCSSCSRLSGLLPPVAAGLLVLVAALLGLSFPAVGREGPRAASEDLSPGALAMSPDGESLYIACASANQVLVFSNSGRSVTRRFTVPGSPSGLALS